jgi:hypothetical protein
MEDRKKCRFALAAATGGKINKKWGIPTKNANLSSSNSSQEITCNTSNDEDDIKKLNVVMSFAFLGDGGFKKSEVENLDLLSVLI